MYRRSHLKRFGSTIQSLSHIVELLDMKLDKLDDLGGLVG